MEGPKLFSRFRIDILLISPSPDFLKRIVQVSEKYNLRSERASDLKEYESNFYNIGRPHVAILDLSNFTEKQLCLETLYGLQAFVPRCELVCIVASDSEKETIQALKEAGVQQILFPKDLLSNVKIDFVLLNKFLLEYYPIEIKDLFPGTEITFNAYHFLKLNYKYLPVVFQDFILSDRKFKKLEKINTLFIKREDAPEYSRYIEKYYDSFKMGLNKRLRANFLQLLLSYSNLRPLLVLSEDEESKDKINFLMNSSWESAQKLIGYSKTSPEPLNFYHQISSELSFFNFDRSLLVGLLAALLADMSGLADPRSVLACGLIAYSGMFSLDYNTFLKWNESNEMAWTKEDRSLFLKTLGLAQEVAIAKMNPLDENMLNVIGCLFERYDGKGLPGEHSGDQVPVEVALLQLTDRWFRQVRHESNQGLPAHEVFQSVLLEAAGSGAVSTIVVEKIQSLGFYKP